MRYRLDTGSPAGTPDCENGHRYIKTEAILLSMNLGNRTASAAVLVLLVMLIVPAGGEPVRSTDYAPWPTDAWTRVPAESQQVNSTILQSMLDHFKSNQIAVDSILIVRNGYLILEEYLSHYRPNDLHHQFSVTKSVLSALIGIAVQEGFIDSISTPMLSFFPNRVVANVDDNKRAMTIGHLLRMDAGFEWNEEHYGTALNDYNRMIRSKDWIQYVLDRRIAARPGEIFQYNSGLSHLLSAILQNSTGMKTVDFAKRYLFDPLGIDEYVWDTDPAGINEGGSKLKLRPLDMAKIGYLFLREGDWDGKQIIPRKWIHSVSTTQLIVDKYRGYSLHWWTLPQLDVYYALGWGSQSIVVMPDYGVVIAVSAATLHKSAEVTTILNKWILPSMGQSVSQQETIASFQPVFVVIAGAPFALILV
ncbi:class C beta-lactamase-related serine hydrolase, partial [Candidatus Thorarchaeota archaeon]